MSEPKTRTGRLRRVMLAVSAVALVAVAAGIVLSVTSGDSDAPSATDDVCESWGYLGATLNDGVCTVDRSLKLEGEYSAMPRLLVVNGNLTIEGTNITALPRGLRVIGDLTLGRTRIQALPEELFVGGDFLFWKGFGDRATICDELPARYEIKGKNQCLPEASPRAESEDDRKAVESAASAVSNEAEKPSVKTAVFKPEQWPIHKLPGAPIAEEHSAKALWPPRRFFDREETVPAPAGHLIMAAVPVMKGKQRLGWFALSVKDAEYSSNIVEGLTLAKRVMLIRVLGKRKPRIVTFVRYIDKPNTERDNESWPPISTLGKKEILEYFSLRIMGDRALSVGFTHIEQNAIMKMDGYVYDAECHPKVYYLEDLLENKPTFTSAFEFEVKRPSNFEGMCADGAESILRDLDGDWRSAEVLCAEKVSPCGTGWQEKSECTESICKPVRIYSEAATRTDRGELGKPVSPAMQPGWRALQNLSKTLTTGEEIPVKSLRHASAVASTLRRQCEQLHQVGSSRCRIDSELEDFEDALKKYLLISEKTPFRDLARCRYGALSGDSL